MSIKVIKVDGGNSVQLPEISIWDFITVIKQDLGDNPVTVTFFGSQVLNPEGKTNWVIDNGGSSFSFWQDTDLNWYLI